MQGLLTLAPAKNILISGPRFLNSPCHQIVLKGSDIEVGHIRVEAPPSYDQMAQSNNTDGIDVRGERVYMHDCNVSVGDDLVVLNANHTLVERMVFGAGRGASISPSCNGSLPSAWLTNSTVRNCSFDRSVRGVRIKVSAGSTAPGGSGGCHGSLSNVLYSNLRMTGVNTTISMTMRYPCADMQPALQCWQKFNSTSMRLDVQIEDLEAVGGGWAGVVDGPSGLEGDRFAALNLRMRNVHMQTSHGWACYGEVRSNSTSVAPSVCGGEGGGD